MRRYPKTRWTPLLCALMIAGCGGGGGGAQATTKAGWTTQHGRAVTTVGTELDAAITALDRGDKQAILGACNLLHDDVTEARKALPVPDPTANSALGAGLDAVATGVTDCIQGARLASGASITERAMTEFQTAKTRMEQANQAIAAWR